MTGEHIAHFEIIRLLGRGGMGEVYLARDRRLDRLVALKTFHHSSSALREARLASAVNHPNVAHIYQAEEVDGLQYIAMEYVEGESLAELMAQRRLSAGEIVNIATQVAEALDEAHQQGVIHRDIKPSNVMISRRGVVKVLDFGLAKANETAPPVESLSSGDGAIIGTIAYLSPEQALGEPIDRRSDIFSFGVLLYEMITGRLPFSGPTVASGLAQLLNDAPASLGPVAPDARALQPIVERCLAKRPEDRFATAGDLADALRSTGAARRLRRPLAPVLARHRRSLVVAAVVVMLVAASALAWRQWQDWRPPRYRSVVVLPFAASDTDDKSLGDGLAETLINRLSRAQSLRVVSRPTAFATARRTQAPRQIARELDVDAVVTGRVTQDGDRVTVQVELVDAKNDRQLWGERYDGTPWDLVRIQDDITASLRDLMRLPPSTTDEHFIRSAMTKDPEAYRNYMIARRLTNDRASSSLRKALGFYAEALKRDPEFALAHAGVAESYIVLVSNRGIDVRKGYAEALRAAERAEQLDPYSAEVQTLLGDIYAYYKWDWDAAERHFRKAIELNPSYVTTRHWYASFLSNLGRHDEAMQQIKIAQQLDPGSPRFIAAEARFLFAARRLDEAERLIKRSLDLNPKNGNSWDQLASIHLAQGRIDESVAAFQKSLNPELAKKVADAYATGGYRAVRLVILDNLTKRAKAGRYVSPADWAIAYARIGDMDGAYRWLEVMYEERSETLLRLHHPSWDPIRKDPRYPALMRKLNLPT